MAGMSIFTLGTDHEPGPLGAYVLVTGVGPEEARKLMIARRGEEWAFQYSGVTDCIRQIERWNLRCVESIAVNTDAPGDYR